MSDMKPMLDVARVLLRKLDELPSTVKSETGDSIAVAHVAATLAVAEELARLREALPVALLDALGDDSHLDKLGRVLVELPGDVERAIGAGLHAGRQR